MKKIIVLAILASLTSVSFGQSKTKETSAIKFSTGQSRAMAITKGNDTLEIVKAGFVTIDSMTVSFADVKEFIDAKKKGAVVLYVAPDWVLSSFNYFRSSRNAEVNDIQMEFLKAPLFPYVQAWQQAQQRALQTSPSKQ